MQRLEGMKNNILSVIACVAMTLMMVSCGEEDEPVVKYEPTIDEYGICIDQEVDLGLSVKWAGWNIGATSPEGYGGYYAWGEIEEKDCYDCNTYAFWTDIDGNGYPDKGEYAHIGDNISGTQYDVATQKWGDSWRMPTLAEFGELYALCKWEYFKYKGVYGQKVTGPNGVSIFLPYAGEMIEERFNLDNLMGWYWTSTLASGSHGISSWSIRLGNGHNYQQGASTREFGYTVRAVK